MPTDPQPGYVAKVIAEAHLYAGCCMSDGTRVPNYGSVPTDATHERLDAAFLAVVRETMKRAVDLVLSKIDEHARGDYSAGYNAALEHVAYDIRTAPLPDYFQKPTGGPTE
jgi:hypothetical protein